MRNSTAHQFRLERRAHRGRHGRRFARFRIEEHLDHVLIPVNLAGFDIDDPLAKRNALGAAARDTTFDDEEIRGFDFFSKMRRGAGGDGVDAMRLHFLPPGAEL